MSYHTISAWSPISCRSSAGQGKSASQRPTFYHCATPMECIRNVALPCGGWCRCMLQVLQCRRRAVELRSSVTRPLRSAAASSGRLTDQRHQNTTETNYKAFVTTLLLTGTLVVFWLPYMIFQLLSAHVPPEQSVRAPSSVAASVNVFLNLIKHVLCFYSSMFLYFS